MCVCVGVCAHVHALLQSGARRKKQVVWRWKKGSHRGSYTRCWPGLQNQTFKGTQWELSTMPHPTRSATEAVTQNHEGKNGGLPLPFLGLLLSLGSSAKSLAERSMNSVVILFYITLVYGQAKNLGEFSILLQSRMPCAHLTLSSLKITGYESCCAFCQEATPGVSDGQLKRRK